MTSREVAEAVGETLEQRADRLRQVVATPSERDIAARALLEVESQIADRDRAALMDEVKARTRAIRRSYPALSDQLDQDLLKVLDAAGGKALEKRWSYAEAVATMVRRWVQLGALRAEYDALNDGFALGEEPLPSVAILGTRKEWLEAYTIVSRVGVPDTNRTRLSEITNSKAYALLERAGKLPTA